MKATAQISSESENEAEALASEDKKVVPKPSVAPAKPALKAPVAAAKPALKAPLAAAKPGLKAKGTLTSSSSSSSSTSSSSSSEDEGPKGFVNVSIKPATPDKPEENPAKKAIEILSADPANLDPKYQPKPFNAAETISLEEDDALDGAW